MALDQPASGELALLAPLSGVIVPLEAVPDRVFAERLVGDGVSIDPTSTTLLAPCDGIVIQLHQAGHAITIRAVGDLEVMIHIGLDTVTLKGQGFTPSVKTGDRVRAGDRLIAFDADFVATHARSLLTQVLLTNMDRVTSLTAPCEMVEAGRDVLLNVRFKADAAGAPEAPGETVQSQPLRILNPTGLHARPAAIVAATVRQFTSDVRLVKDGSEANLRSVVSIMALEVSGGDTVTVVARGPDAREAVDRLSRLLADELRESEAPGSIAGLATTARIAEPSTSAIAGRNDILRGVSASPGIALGRIFQLRVEDDVVQERASDPNHERRALDAALASAHVQLEAVQKRLSEEADAQRAAIFGAHQELLEDPEVLDAAAERIRDGATAAYAWRESYRRQAERLLGLRNPVLAGRAADLHDVGRRVLHLLIGRDDVPHDFPADAIVVAEDLVPSDAAALDQTSVRGFCTTAGSATSHVAILARALGIPAVTGIDPRVLGVSDGTRVVLDGGRGHLLLNPTPEQESLATEQERAAEAIRQSERAASLEPAVTVDGHRIEVVANIGSEADARRAVELGGEGVGLLRTEFLFMHRRTAPDEEEQTSIYERIARALGPDRILVIRTLDVGGDKPLPYLPMNVEANPFLGERGIRLLIARPEVFRTQLRAILRASTAGRVAVMFPMIATLGEWRAAREILESERGALGVAPIQVGIMVETPAAALLADRFAEEADFFSIGTNDLTQYALAMDRTNPRLAPAVDALHPAVLRLIERTVAGAHARGRWVGVCGGLAGEPQAVPLLLGLGVNELSVAAPAIPAVKAQIRTLSMHECREKAALALGAADAAAVRALVPA
jgi:phosphoenolpyruvate-protein phosphotransferase